ncbi:MAG: diacylglycerol kinase [Tepidimonas ignava]|uniref:Diacylglycerol kinase n=1 Tax=Tepidimonas ignava TaxID=114249 RepID=A0A4R3LJ52_9BURK|nr:diacylglycerol kinase [Tepidimonas ignava]TCS99508.1 diacylglycerol kinase (ATP) [Tepidimonas ignava]TSE22008.1 Diacylglycerol kinase [Tepidimonas ignava]
MTRPPEPPPKRHGVLRLWHALRYSWDGLRAGWREPALRQELVLGAVLLPAAWWVGRDAVHVALLALSVVAVWVVELLNTAVESVVDRIGPEWHPLAKRAKDMGSAAVLLTLLASGGLWAWSLWAWWRG